MRNLLTPFSPQRGLSETVSGFVLLLALPGPFHRSKWQLGLARIGLPSLVSTGALAWETGT